ncbi:patatin-like phospholipase family protein [Chitinophaga sedimenti]|uniref:patatin-like phospholipase family protein n=1 Tax=Chitinophaga sedimenti TaxID=2033606 RepID=UPI0020060BEC|nr:patatin-like phospholipase family protein [Chitinophaga sedimenti]MCK7558735.1 patatin-like phospholipase family protein [Chitinophaga sedimenti]
MNTSGGGSRSALWTLCVMQRLDSLLNFGFSDRTTIITGASGGMMGATYYRELYLQRMMGERVNPCDTIWKDKISGDLLNAVFGSLAVNDFITPYRTFRIGDNKYGRDRGYAFETQLNINTGDALAKSIGDYREAEQKSLIPMLIWNSTINADGRRLLISPQRVSYLCAADYLYPNRNVRDIDGVDFSQFLLRRIPTNCVFRAPFACVPPSLMCCRTCFYPASRL